MHFRGKICCSIHTVYTSQPIEFAYLVQFSMSLSLFLVGHFFWYQHKRVGRCWLSSPVSKLCNVRGKVDHLAKKNDFRQKSAKERGKNWGYFRSPFWASQKVEGISVEMSHVRDGGITIQCRNKDKYLYCTSFLGVFSLIRWWAWGKLRQIENELGENKAR